MRLSSRRVLSLTGGGQSIHVDRRKIKEKADAISLFDFSVQQPQPTPPDRAYRSRLFSAISMCPLIARRSKTMLGLTTAKSISATARASVRCPIGSVFDFVGHDFFQNYTRWCPQVIELEPLSDGPVRAG